MLTFESPGIVTSYTAPEVASSLEKAAGLLFGDCLDLSAQEVLTYRLAPDEGMIGSLKRDPDSPAMEQVQDLVSKLLVYVPTLTAIKIDQITTDPGMEGNVFTLHTDARSEFVPNIFELGIPEYRYALQTAKAAMPMMVINGTSTEVLTGRIQEDPVFCYKIPDFICSSNESNVVNSRYNEVLGGHNLTLIGADNQMMKLRKSTPEPQGEYTIRSAAEGTLYLIEPLAIHRSPMRNIGRTTLQCAIA